MWRKCDLHRHTVPDRNRELDFDAREFVIECIAEGLEVIAVTDHDHSNNVAAVVREAGGKNLIVIPGVEVSTDRGHVIAFAPGDEGLGVLEEFCERVPVSEVEEAEFDRVAEVLSDRRRSGNRTRFREHLVLVAAHADRTGSLLGPNQTHSIPDQIRSAQRLHALEIVNEALLTGWRQGIKQTQSTMALLRGSDYHPLECNQRRFTWIYLPVVTAHSLQHAFATHEASISHCRPTPNVPEFWIKSIRLEGGPYDGRMIDFLAQSQCHHRPTIIWKVVDY